MIQAFLWNIFLALIWSAMLGEISLSNLLVGFGLGYLILFFLKPASGFSQYLSRFHQVVGFLFFFAWELLLANLRVAFDVITPSYRMRPGVIAIPLDAETELEITTLANLISLTPGSLSLDVSPDRKVLYVHAMFITDREIFCREIKEGLEKRLLQVLR